MDGNIQLLDNWQQSQWQQQSRGLVQPISLAFLCRTSKTVIHKYNSPSTKCETMQGKEEMLKEIDHRWRQPILQMIVYEQVKANNLTDLILCSTHTCGYLQPTIQLSWIKCHCQCCVGCLCLCQYFIGLIQGLINTQGYKRYI